MKRNYVTNGLIVTLNNGDTFVAEKPEANEAMVKFLGEALEKQAQEILHLKNELRALETQNANLAHKLAEEREKNKPKDVLKYQYTLLADAERLMSEGQKIAAIKEYRRVNGGGMKEAIDFIRFHWQHLKTVREW